MDDLSLFSSMRNTYDVVDLKKSVFEYFEGYKW